MMAKRILILEGGGMRAAFSCGVMNALHQLQASFDEVVGISSGAICGLFYQSGQFDVLRTLFLDFADTRFFRLQSFLHGQGLINLKSLMDKPIFHKRFDAHAFWHNPVPYYVSLTRMGDGASVFMEKAQFQDLQECLEAVMASACLPFISKPIFLRGVAYMDGGINDSIPLSRYAHSDDRLLVVHTQPPFYRKKKNVLAPLLYAPFRKNAQLYERLKTRPERYNHHLDILDSWCDDGRAYVLQPALHRIGRYTQNRKAVCQTYIDGYHAVMQQQETLLRFLNDPSAISKAGE